jgi:hypothetical protein
MAVDRQKLMLGGLAAVVVIGGYVMTRPAAPATPAASARARDARVAQKADPKKTDLQVAGEVSPVKLAALTASREEPGEAQRNPFRFKPRVVAPPPRPAVTAAPPVVDTTPRPPPAPAGPPPAPPIPLKLIGVLERANGVKWAVLTDGKSPTPMYGKDGDIIDGRYTIVKIGTESIEMTHADGRGRQVIRLTGQ